METVFKQWLRENGLESVEQLENEIEEGRIMLTLFHDRHGVWYAPAKTGSTYRIADRRKIEEMGNT